MTQQSLWQHLVLLDKEPEIQLPSLSAQITEKYTRELSEAFYAGLEAVRQMGRKKNH